MGGDWYVRASGDALFEVAKPSIHKGIGVDAIPDFIKHDSSFSSNDLGRLGNIEKLPSEEEIAKFKQNNPSKDYMKLGKKLLDDGKIHDAWSCFLLNEIN